MEKLHSCGTILAPSMTFCPKCGEQVVAQVRSENEIKIALKIVSDFFPRSLPAVGLQLSIISTLKWVLGDRMGPHEMVEQIKIVEKRAGTSGL